MCRNSTPEGATLLQVFLVRQKDGYSVSSFILFTRMIGACNDSYIYTDKPEHVDCTKHTCGFYEFLVNEGSMPARGSSGGGIVDDERQAVIGVLSGSTDNLGCPSDFTISDGDSYGVFGSLAAVS